MNRTITLLYIFAFSIAAPATPSRPSALRRAVDVYNAVGTSSRWIAFMKIGSSASDERHLNTLNAQVSGRGLPRAQVDGGVIYFRGLSQPLKVVDLRRRLFSINGRTLDLRAPTTLERRLTALDRLLFPKREAFFWIDWILPQAVAATNSREAASLVSGIVGLSGLAANIQCFEDGQKECGDQFMGSLGALGETGGISGANTPNIMFCIPDLQGGTKLVIADRTQKILEVSRSGDDFLIGPRNQVSSRTEQLAAAALMKSCESKRKLAAYNVAFAYPSVELSTTTRGVAYSPAAIKRTVPEPVYESDASDAAQ